MLLKTLRASMVVILSWCCLFLSVQAQGSRVDSTVKIKPMSIKNLVKTGSVYLKSGDYESAQAYFEKAITLNRSYFYFNRDDETDTAIVRNLIFIYMRNQDWKKAEELYEIYAIYASDNPNANTLEIAKLLFKQKRYAEARVLLQDLLADQEFESSKNFKSLRTQAENLLKMCSSKTSQLSSQDLVSIKRTRSQRLSKLPKLIEVNRLRYLGAEYRSRRQYPKAIEFYTKALILNRPYMGQDMRTDHHIVGCLIAIYKKMGKWKDAEEMYETYGRNQWISKHIDLEVAELLEKQGRYAEARAVLQPWVDTLRKPMNTGCGTVRMLHSKNLSLLRQAEAKTPNLSKDQMDKIIKVRDRKYGRVRVKITEKPKFDLGTNPTYKFLYITKRPGS